MSFKIKNWKLTGLALLFFLLFISLGGWQLSRAAQKRALLETFEMRMQHKPLSSSQFQGSKSDLRFFRTKISGTFDNQHSFLLDNKTLDGKIGYELYTPFKVSDSNHHFLVDRGFIPAKGRRDSLPKIKALHKKTTITALINTPPAYFALGQVNESKDIKWPLRVEYIELKQLAQFLNYPLYNPYILQLDVQAPGAYQVKWQIVIMKPEKHMAYAIQWFAFALTLLVLFLALNRRGQNKKKQK